MLVAKRTDPRVLKFLRRQARKGGKNAWAGKGEAERKRILSERARAGWAKKTAEERSLEMRRRAKVRAKRKLKK
jgi:hypothetical protein